MKDKKKLSAIGITTAVIILGSIVFVSSQFRNTESAASVKGTSAQPSPKKLVATLSIYEGGVYVKKPGEKTFTPAKEKEQLPVGSEVSTNKEGRAQIIYDSGTVTRLDYESRIKIEQYQAPHSIRVKILEGRIWSRIKKLFGKESYETESGNVIATVRGTSYNHGVKTKGFDTAIVLEGSVSITCIENKKTVVVDTEEKGVMNCDKPETLKTASLTEKETSDEWIQFNMLEDILLEEGTDIPKRGNTLPDSTQVSQVPTSTPQESSGTSVQTTPPTNTPVPATQAPSSATNTPVPATPEPAAERTAPSETPVPTVPARTAPPTDIPTPPARSPRDASVQIELSTPLINVNIGLL